jgi:hypothetical protein
MRSQVFTCFPVSAQRASFFVDRIYLQGVGAITLLQAAMFAFFTRPIRLSAPFATFGKLALEASPVDALLSPFPFGPITPQPSACPCPAFAWLERLGAMSR